MPEISRFGGRAAREAVGGVRCKCPRVFMCRKEISGPGVCPVKGLKKCEFCGDIKKSICAKAACKEARAAARD